MTKMRFLKPLVALISAILLFCLNPSVVAAQQVVDRTDAANDTMRLMELQRYGEALDSLLVLSEAAPQERLLYDIRGTLALQIGDIADAQSNFRNATVQLSSDAVANYGLGVCSLLQHNPGQALVCFDFCRKNASLGELGTVDLAESVSLAAQGEIQAALTKSSSANDPAASEMTALLMLKTNPSAGIRMLTNLLDSVAENGVPCVLEPAGIRLRGALSAEDTIVEPSVTEGELQQIYTQWLQRNSKSDALSGAVRVVPHIPVSSDIRSVTLQINGKLIATISSAPYEFLWDTSPYANGSYSAHFAATDSTGQIVATDDQTLEVGNPRSGLSTQPFPPDIEDRLWNLIRLHPAYKVAEGALARHARIVGDKDGFATHLMRAVALDPEYGSAEIDPIFAGRVPATMPLPDGTSLPSMGLSAGEASNSGFWAGTTHGREIALTFDDGPVLPGANELIDALYKAKAKATFFVVGMRAAQFPDCVRKMAEEGFDVEDHSYSHPNLDQVLPIHVLQEIVRNGVIVQALTGHWPYFLRPPGGNTNPDVLETARRCGMTGAFWTIDALPAEDTASSALVVQWVMARARPGAIVLMHNGVDSTIGAIPALVAGLRAKGYNLVTIKQLAADTMADAGKPGYFR